MLDDRPELVTKPEDQKERKRKKDKKDKKEQQEFIAAPQELIRTAAGSYEMNPTSFSMLGTTACPSRRGSCGTWTQAASSSLGSWTPGVYYSENVPAAQAISSTAPVSSTVLPTVAASNVAQLASSVPVPVMVDVGQSPGMTVLPTLAAQSLTQMTSTLSPLEVMSENAQSSGTNLLPTQATQGVMHATSTPAPPQVAPENWQSRAEQMYAEMTSNLAPLQAASENVQSSNVTVRPAVWPRRATSSLSQANLSQAAPLPVPPPAAAETMQSSVAVLKSVEVPCVQTRVEERCVDVPLIQEVERYVPVPLIQVKEVVKQVPKLSIQEKIVQVPQIETKIEEKIIEIPQIQEVERRVIVPQVEIQEVEKEVPVISVKEKIVPVPHLTTRITEKIVEVPQIEEVTKYIPVPQVQRQEIIRRVPTKIYAERVVPVPQVQQPVSIVTRTGPALIYEGGFHADIADGGDGYRLGPPVAVQVDGYAGDYLGGFSSGVMSPVLSPNPSFAPVAAAGDFSSAFGRAPLLGFPSISPVGSVSAMVAPPVFSSSIEAAVGGYVVAPPVTALDIPIGQYSFQPSGS